MSTQPIPIAANQQQQAAALLKKQQRSARRSDALYVAGALLVAAGLGCIRFYLAPIALGVFCLIFPGLELATGFIRGLHAPHTQQARR
jgi:hypothetical protein